MFIKRFNGKYLLHILTIFSLIVSTIFINYPGIIPTHKTDYSCKIYDFEQSILTEFDSNGDVIKKYNSLSDLVGGIIDVNHLLVIVADKAVSIILNNIIYGYFPLIIMFVIVPLLLIKRKNYKSENSEEPYNPLY